MPLRLLFCTRYGTCEHPPKAVYCSEKPHSLHLQHRLQNLSGLCARARAQRLLYKLLSTTYSTTLHCFTLYSLNCSLYGFISHATCAPFSSPHKHVKYKATGHYVRLHDTCIREETHIRLFTVLSLLFLTSDHAAAATTHRLPTSHTPHASTILMEAEREVVAEVGAVITTFAMVVFGFSGASVGFFRHYTRPIFVRYGVSLVSSSRLQS